MEISFNMKTFELKNKAEPYHNLLQDFIGNKVGFLFGLIELYDMSSKEDEKENYLNRFVSRADKTHKIFDEMVDSILAIMAKEKIKGRLLTLIKILKKSSDFDWKSMEDFKKFEGVYERILKNLKRLS